jgi:hypothetical protein
MKISASMMALVRQLAARAVAGSVVLASGVRYVETFKQRLRANILASSPCRLVLASNFEQL